MPKTEATVQWRFKWKIHVSVILAFADEVQKATGIYAPWVAELLL